LRDATAMHSIATVEGPRLGGPVPFVLLQRGERARSTVCRGQVRLLVLVHAAALAALAFPTARGAIGLALGWLLCGVGVSLGYHRGLAHNAFRAAPGVRGALALLGALALQGGPLAWVNVHRAHHRFTDGEGDAHAAARGFLWSHVLWAVHKGPNGYRPMKMRRLLGTLAGDPFLRWLERHHRLLNLAVAAAVLLAFGWQVALWAIPLRIVVCWHLTWLTNSIGHQRGASPSARNVRWLALLNFGEGLHLNHHLTPGRACFARRQGEVDLGHAILAGLGRCRLVHLPVRRSLPDACQRGA
jgi:fatty-acid desaturase